MDDPVKLLTNLRRKTTERRFQKKNERLEVFRFDVKRGDLKKYYSSFSCLLGLKDFERGSIEEEAAAAAARR